MDEVGTGTAVFAQMLGWFDLKVMSSYDCSIPETSSQSKHHEVNKYGLRSNKNLAPSHLKNDKRNGFTVYKAKEVL